jgi:D-alanyl-D-alanine carboxypeptidase
VVSQINYQFPIILGMTLQPMRDRYYILLLITAIGMLSGWLVAYNSFGGADVVAYNGRFEVPRQTSVNLETQMLTEAARQGISVQGVSAASNTPAGLPVSPNRPVDPIRIDGATEFTTSASSAIIMNEQTGHVLYSANGNEIRSIASITKLFTALVFLDFNPGWDKLYTVKKTDRRDGGRVYVWAGEQLKIKDLFNLSLVASGNSETVALVNATGLGEELFVKKMNEKAKMLGLSKTVFKDVVGLDERNVSTAVEIAKFARVALGHAEISEVVTNEDYQCKTEAGRMVNVSSTDELLGTIDKQGLSLNGGKTGFNNRAGYCFVGKFANDSAHSLISVVLGEATKQSRFSETLDLVDWAYNNFAWPESID